MTLLIAHRGFSARFRENSEPAWEAALEEGAQGIEDIRRSADGVFVCAHDADLRLAGRPELIADMHSAALASIKAEGEPVAPAFEAALSCIPESTLLLLDVKEENPPTLLSLLECLDIHQRKNVVLGLHSLQSVAFCREHTALPILGLLNGEESKDEALFTLGGTALRLWESQTSVERVARLAANGRPMWMTVGGWGTGREVGDFEPVHLRKMQAAGVSGFLVNDPALARQALATVK